MKYFWYYFLLLFGLASAPLAAKSTVYFSPDDDPRTKLVELIDNAQESILVAVYTFTEHTLAKALARAQERGVQVEVVLDCFSRSKWGKIHTLEKAGITVHLYEPTLREGEKYLGIMHDKFAVFDNTKVWTGSYNWTFKASFTNQENAVLIENEPDVIMRFAQQFEVLKERCNACSGHRKIPAHYQETLATTWANAWHWLCDCVVQEES